MNQSWVEIVTTIATAQGWSAWVTAIATFVLAVLTFVYVRLTRKILSRQSDPCVVLTVVHDEERATILQLVAKNVGTGLAHDIRFEFSHPIPSRAFGISPKDAKEAEEMKEGPLITGIPALGPGECRVIDWGQYGGLKVALDGKKILAICRFKRNGKEMEPTKCPLDVESFAYTVAVETPAVKSARELEKISKAIQQFASGFNSLKVEVISSPDEDRSNESV